MKLLRYIGAVFETLLPPRYRMNTALRNPAMVCGIAQTLVMLLLLVIRLIRFWQQPDVFQQSGLSPEIIYEAATRIGESAAYGSSIFLMVDFVFSPLNVFILYLSMEGMIRTMAALVGHQVLGSLPLYLISGIHGLIDKKRHARELGPLIPDKVVRGGAKQGYDLKVYSCRPKLNWNPYMTVEFEDEFYQMFKEEPGFGQHRFIYYLRKNPTGRVVVVIDHYKIDDVLKPAPDKWEGTPTLWHKLTPKKSRPMLPDEIIRATEKANYDLKIYSCVQKKDWNYYVTIEFEDELYQMFKEESGPEPRPFVYYLKKNPVGRPASIVRHYQNLRLD